MPAPPEIAIIAGFDGSGGAGVTVDGETVRQLGATPRFVVTALTAQTDEAGYAVEATSGPMLQSHLDAAFAFGDPRAIKIGMLPNLEVVSLVAAQLQSSPNIPVVLDPVLSSSSGLALMGADCLDGVRDELIPRASLVTPNLDEVRRFTDLKCESRDDMARAGEQFLSDGAQAVLVKGGHLKERLAADCLLVEGSEPAWFESPRVEGAFRGTGCRLSTAIATRLAFGDDLPASVAAAKVYLTDFLQRQTG
ncbi:MAG: hydroxymethylpyrimidine/phosphomethylpyrimidine kinase [Opitutales bacterium]